MRTVGMRVIVLLLPACVLAGLGCTATGRPAAASLRWTPCGEALLADGECTTIEVPLDYEHPRTATIELALFRLRSADETDGVLLVNPGGPGASAIDYVASRGRAGFPASMTVVAFDPRGVARSHPVHCGTIEQAREDWGAAALPASGTELTARLARVRARAQQCAATDLGAHAGTVDVARDMDRVRAALGVDKASFVGFSYGTRLGWTYANLFPGRVRAMVLDGPEDPTASARETLVRQATVIESLIADFSNDCATAKSWTCPDDARAAITEVITRANRSPIPTGGDEPPLSGNYALSAVLTAFYDEQTWPDLAAGLTDALHGDGLALLRLSFNWQQYHDLSLIDAAGPQDLIYCVDHPSRLTPEAFTDVAAEVQAAVPTLAGSFPGPIPRCYGFPVVTSEPQQPTAWKGSPILVVSATGDLATPHDGAIRLTESLGTATLLTRDGPGHTSYGLNRCIDQLVDKYLTTLSPPTPGTICT